MTFCPNVRKGEQPPWIILDDLRAEISPLLSPHAPGLLATSWRGDKWPSVMTDCDHDSNGQHTKL